jgi:hypothetical protein
MPADLTTPESFIEYWSKAEASEMANSQSFVNGLTRMLGVPQPANTHAEGYSFNFPLKVPGTVTTNWIDLYRRGHFVWESKQFADVKQEQSELELVAIKAGVVEPKKKSGPVRGTGAWDDAMLRARGQAERYVRQLPAEEPNPPFIIVCDVGHTFEIYADFTQNGKAYLPFPDPRTFRIKLTDLADEKIRERLRLIWTNPTALDPAKVSAEVTREIAGYLAELAKSLEQAKHDPETVAQFLTRCLFCMFAEDVGLLPENSFKDLLDSLPPDGSGFVKLVGTLFQEMNTGTKGDISVVLRKKLLRFNGGLFSDDTVLPINGLQLGLLKQAASKQWKNVEPAIFGTLLERALNPTERHALGAHFTPRAYVERLVLPTVIEPLRAEWENIRAAAVAHAKRDDIVKAREEIDRFHDYLCKVTVLDPACGSGNFLYVALAHLKALESEVIDFAIQIGGHQRLDLYTHTIDPHQFLGIELNPRAASIAELVLWIGYLQWHFRTRGQIMPEEPVLKSFKNIECRDAVLDYDGDPVPALDDNGEIITVWDRKSMKVDFVTGRNVPDESKRVPLLTYTNPRPATWPAADFIVGNPPFLGTKRMRENLGDGYVETLRKLHEKAIEDNADFVMFWWHKAAVLCRSGNIKRFGLITTNSLRQSFNRRVMQHHLRDVSILFAIPDHPWVDSAEGAAVRIAMTVVSPGQIQGQLLTVISEVAQEDESSKVSFKTQIGRIAADLSVGADLPSMTFLKANEGVCGLGVALHGSGFILEPLVAQELRIHGASVIKPYLGGSDLVRDPRERYLIDFSFMTEAVAQEANPVAFQHVLTHVRPERLPNRRAAIRRLWWRYGWERPEIRKALVGLNRYIGTTETAKHRIFQFIDGAVLPDHMIIVFASDDSFQLGALSSHIHIVFSLAAGGRLGVGNDPRYNKTRCFDPFPFPLCDEATKDRIRAIAEELDANRKRVQAQHGITLTGLYNVLEKLRANQPLTDKEKTIHDKGLVSILKQLHDDLDAAVAAAYGWPADLTDAEILTRLVALNAHRAAEERQGIIHWLRPDYQKQFLKPDKQAKLDLSGKGIATGKTKKGKATKKPKKKAASKKKLPWPKPMAERIRTIEQALHAADYPVTAAELAKPFSRAKSANVQEILESLVALGRAHEAEGKFSI